MILTFGINNMGNVTIWTALRSSEEPVWIKFRTMSEVDAEKKLPLFSQIFKEADRIFRVLPAGEEIQDAKVIKVSDI